MILEIATLPARPGEEEAFTAAMKQALPLLQRQRGFIGAEFCRCVEEPLNFRLVVRWQTLEDHTKGFRGSPDHAELLRIMKPFYASAPSIFHCEPLLTT